MIDLFSDQERSMGDDLRTMLCADNLAMAKSSLIHLLGFHSTAARLYYPWKCDPELRKIARLHPETKRQTQFDSSASSLERHTVCRKHSGRAWGQHGQRGGDGWNQNGPSFLRGGSRSGKFRDWVPLPWLALVVFQAVEYGLAAYEVETEDVDELVQRCNFHVATATAGDAANLDSLQDLLHLVHDSALAFGPTALPKLLDSGVVPLALRGAESPNEDVSAVCYRILAVLSQNRHIAQTMSSEPALRAVLVRELRRQVKGWNSNPSQSSGPGEGVQTSGHGQDESAQGVSLSEEGHGESRPPPASIVVDPIHLTLTLEALRNVMRASRRRSNSRRKTASAVGAGPGLGAGTGWGSEGTSDSRAMLIEEEGADVPWPFRSLYGEDNYYRGTGGAGGGVRGYDAGAGVALGEEQIEGSDDHWPLDRKLVADIAELMLSAASVRGSEAGLAHDENAALGEVLEAAAASTLREISCHPPLVGMLLRRRPLVGLVAVSQDSVMAEQASSEGAINICREYRRVHGLPERSEPKISQADVIDWVNKTLTEEWAGSPAGDLGLGEADQAFVQQAERSTLPPSPYHGAVVNLQISGGVGMAIGVPWGAGRRWMAWRRAGETFSAVSRLAFPRALMWAGLRAGLGAAALVATHGPVGFRPQARPFSLDATSGRRGTLAMSAAREVAELGYLYAILRLCPYSLLPSLAISAVVWNDHRYGGALGDWGA
eukprot:g12766.t1